MGRPKNIDTKHIGADVPDDLAEAFSGQCKERGFIISRVMTQFVTWWTQAPEEIQKQFYHARKLKTPEVRLLTTDNEVRQYIRDVLPELLNGVDQNGETNCV